MGIIVVGVAGVTNPIPSGARPRRQNGHMRKKKPPQLDAPAGVSSFAPNCPDHPGIMGSARMLRYVK